MVLSIKNSKQLAHYRLNCFHLSRFNCYTCNHCSSNLTKCYVVWNNINKQLRGNHDVLDDSITQQPRQVFSLNIKLQYLWHSHFSSTRFRKHSKHETNNFKSRSYSNSSSEKHTTNRPHSRMNITSHLRMLKFSREMLFYLLVK